MPWQVRHSKVRSSKPRSPGEIRATPILCLQVGQDGRSPMEMIITQHPTTNDRAGEEFWSVRLPTLGQNFDASLASQEPPCGVFERGCIVAPNWGALFVDRCKTARSTKQASARKPHRRRRPAGSRRRAFLVNETKLRRWKGQSLEYQ